MDEPLLIVLVAGFELMAMSLVTAIYRYPDGQTTSLRLVGGEGSTGAALRAQQAFGNDIMTGALAASGNLGVVERGTAGVMGNTNDGNAGFFNTAKGFGVFGTTGRRSLGELPVRFPDVAGYFGGGSGLGVVGASDTNIGVYGAAGDVPADYEFSLAGVVGVSGKAFGVYAFSDENHGLVSQSDDQTGVVGVAGTPPPYELSPAGVWGFGPTGVQGLTEAADGFGGEFENRGGGLALRVSGRAAFPVGRAQIGAGSESVFVEWVFAQADTHVMVTFLAQPRGGTIPWVELHPGKGFTLHLGHGRTRVDLPFTYLIFESAAAPTWPT